MKIVAIACGLLSPKKDYTEINKKNLYLNYGLLGLCTLLAEHGHEIKQFQGEYLKPYELIEIINASDFNLSTIKTPVIISIVSFFSIDWCNELTRIIKTEYGLKCIVGGKYVVDGNIMWLKEKLPYVFRFIEGDGEEIIESVLEDKSTHSQIHNIPYQRLDYSLVHDYKKYNPYIELSRGCGRGCPYCADSCRKASKIKNAKNIINELAYYEKLYDYKPFNVYFQMPSFIANKKWINDYQESIRGLNHIIPWRCTARIDEINTNTLTDLYAIGLRVIDLGLESASSQQLILMKKTTNPKEYLKKAKENLKAIYDAGIWAKLNILFTAGENKKTIGDTIDWLMNNKELIKGISVNYETIFGPRNTLIEELIPLGASFVNENDLFEKGYSYINLSEEIDYFKAKEIISAVLHELRDCQRVFLIRFCLAVIV